VAENKINLNLGVKTSGLSGVQKLGSSLTNLSRNSKQLTTGFGTLQKGIKKLDMRFTNITKDANRMNKSFLSVGKSLGGLNKLIGAGSMYLLARGISGATNSALDMIEVTNLFSVSLGDATEEASKFTVELSKISGLDNTNIQGAVGTFALLSRSMGVGTENARVLGENVYKLGLDLSSLTNVPINQVMQDLRSGLVGQSETVYKYGLDVTEASLKQEAMNQGIEKSVRNMSQGEKMALRYSVMIKKSNLAHGDFAKTIETPANQLRILKERFTTLARSVGTIFIPILSATLPYLNALMQVLTDLTNVIARLVGFEPPKFGDAMGNLGDSANDAEEAVDGVGKALQNLRGGFDELNTLSSASGSDGTGVSAGDPNDFDFGTYDNMMDQVALKSDEIYEKISGALGGAFQELVTIMQPLIDGLTSLGSVVYTNLLSLFNDILVPMGEWAGASLLPAIIDALGISFELLGTVIETAKPTMEAFWNDVLEPMGRWSGKALIKFLTELSSILSHVNIQLEQGDPFWTGLVDVLSKLAIAFGVVVAGAKVVSAVLAVLGTVVGVVKVIFGALSAVVGIVKLVMAGFAVVASAVSAPVALIVAGVAALIAIIVALVLNWETAWTTIKTFTAVVVAIIVGAFNGMVNAVVGIFSTISDAVAGFIGRVKMLVDWLVDGMILGFTSMIDIVATIFENVGEGIITALNFIKGGIKSAMDAIAGVFVGVWNFIISVFETGINSVIDGLNAFIKFVNKAFDAINDVADAIGIDSINLGISTVSKISIDKLPQLASGGIVGTGQMFIANEAGPELVGSFGNQTGVINNEQIVDSVSQGVANAVASVLGNQDGNQQPLVIELDGEVIYKNQEKVARNRGVNFNLGAFAR